MTIEEAIKSLTEFFEKAKSVNSDYGFTIILDVKLNERNKIFRVNRRM